MFILVAIVNIIPIGSQDALIIANKGEKGYI